MRTIKGTQGRRLGSVDLMARCHHAMVLAQAANSLAAPALRIAMAEFLGRIESDPGVRIVGDSDGLCIRGLALYAGRPDKAWSLTDCISFVVMGDEGLTDALTGDRHFEQAGFKALLV